MNFENRMCNLQKGFTMLTKIDELNDQHFTTFDSCVEESNFVPIQLQRTFTATTGIGTNRITGQLLHHRRDHFSLVNQCFLR